MGFFRALFVRKKKETPKSALPDHSAKVHGLENRVSELTGKVKQWEEFWEKQRKYQESQLAKAADQFKVDKSKSLAASRSTTRGIISEELSPLIPGWKYSFSDTRHWGTRPFDFIVLDGLEAGQPVTVRFVEVKTGTSQQLSSTEKKLKEAVDSKRVTYEVFNFTRAVSNV